MAKTAQQFIKNYNGKRIDDDGAFNVQCVDGFRVFNRYIGYPVLPTGTGWADGYWYNRNKQYSKYYDFITDTKNLQEGDWLFWARGSSCVNSHVSMFVSYANSTKTKANCFGEQQTGPHTGFSTVPLKLDILGAFRPKEWSNTAKHKLWVETLYPNILNRKGEASGINAWTTAIDNGTTAFNVLTGFFNSKEYINKKKSNTDFVKDCYKAILLRNAESQGLNAWVKVLNGGKSRTNVIKDFCNSVEFQKTKEKYKLK